MITADTLILLEKVVILSMVKAALCVALYLLPTQRNKTSVTVRVCVCVGGGLSVGLVFVNKKQENITQERQ